MYCTPRQLIEREREKKKQDMKKWQRKTKIEQNNEEMTDKKKVFEKDQQFFFQIYSKIDIHHTVE